MINKVLNTITKHKLIENGDKILAAVSGGPDSIAMLDVLLKIKNGDLIKFDIIVAHVNHMIREEATSDEQFVENYCKKNKIKCFVKRIDVPEYANNNKIGHEEAGRILRYKFFDEIMTKEHANKVAIAHNKNDKIETMIMNMLRGTGISGLKGIEVLRDNKYIRPIIDIEREEIEEYCEINKLDPRIDKTNFINDCTRNKIRNIVIPYIKKEFNPNFIKTMDRLSDVIAEEDRYMQKITEEIYNKICISEIENEKEIILNLKEFNNQEEILRKRIIMYSIEKCLGNLQNIEKVNIEDIIKLCNNNIGNKYLMPNKNIKIKIEKGKIFFVPLIELP